MTAPLPPLGNPPPFPHPPKPPTAWTGPLYYVDRIAADGHIITYRVAGADDLDELSGWTSRHGFKARMNVAPYATLLGGGTS